MFSSQNRETHLQAPLMSSVTQRELSMPRTPRLMPLRFAPWLPERRMPGCFYKKVRGLLGVVASLLLLLYMAVLGLCMLLLEIPRKILRHLLMLGAKYFGFVVEHAYMLRICSKHVNISRMIQQRVLKRPFHSRFADIRTTLHPFSSQGTCFVHAVPCLTDNFCYVLVSNEIGESSRASGLPAVVVDPCDAEAVEEALDYLAHNFYAEYGGIELQAVLCTHKHWDHSGGNEQLVARAAASAAALEHQANSSCSSASEEDRSQPLEPPSLLTFAHPLKVYGGLEDDVPGCTSTLQHGDRFLIGGLSFEAVGAPGHTVGSIMFRLICEATRVEALFTGDAVFSGGCGAPFEGNELDIEHGFATILETCKPNSTETLLFPGHEYTARLLEFRLQESLSDWASTESPGRFMALCSAFYVSAHRRALRDKLPTVPVSLAGERMVNPYFDHGLRQRAKALLDAHEDLDVDEKLPSSLPASATEPPHLPIASTGVGGNKKHYDVGYGPPPSQQLAVFFRSDLENLRNELKSGKLSTAAAASKLADLESRVFADTQLTGGMDSFDDEGLDADDEDAIRAEENGARGPETGSETSGREDATEEKKKKKPSKRAITDALKVLAVPAFVPVGPKAPCKDDQLPVCLKRLETVLSRLHLPSDRVTSLVTALLVQEYSDSSSSSSSSCDEATAASDGRLIPLEKALRGLSPEVESSFFTKCLSRVRRCFLTLTCGRSGTSSIQDAHDDEADQEHSSRPPVPEHIRRRRRLVAVEHRFSAHKPECCLLCSSSFRSQSQEDSSQMISESSPRVARTTL
eukprot:TRINITY_DN16845_c0_g1_i1.p1 TRINITY_DN16845_c0_g1~~TRINITY_DN16845_c0_g1_i1.p1  ORF type:complete len:803 (-),score=120.13 TRINITY_DN16845_c0_g1_i1:155-2563(-)